MPKNVAAWTEVNHSWSNLVSQEKLLLELKVSFVHEMKSFCISLLNDTNDFSLLLLLFINIL